MTWLRALFALALVALGLRAALPWVTERVLEGVLSNVLDAPLEIDDVDLWLREGEITLRGVALRGVEGSELAAAERVILDADWGALVAGSLEAETLTIERPELFVAFDAEGRLNWDAVAESGNDAQVGEPAPDCFVKIRRIDLGAGTLRLVDEAADGSPSVRLALGALALEGLEIERAEPGGPLRWGLASADASDWQLGIAPDSDRALDFGVRAGAGPIDAEGRIPIEVELVGAGGAEFEIAGELLPTPLEVRAQVRWRKLHSRALLPLLPLSGVRVERGSSSGALEVSLDLGDVASRGLAVRGSATHDDLVLLLPGDEGGRLEVARVEAELAHLWVPIPVVPPEPPEPVRIQWSRIEIAAPSVDVTLPEAGERAAEPQAPGGGAAAKADTLGLDVRVDALTLRDGRVRWRDPAVGPAHEQTLSSIEIDASALRWPELSFDRGRLVVGSLGDEPLRIEGTMPPGRADLSLRARRISLPPWNPTIVQYSDYSVAAGTLSLTGTLRRRGDEYDAPFTVATHGLQATSEGEAFQKTFGMPLAAAISLLADPAGNIKIAVPIRGHLTRGMSLDLTSAITGALHEAIVNALGGALATPLDAVGTVFRRVGELAVMGMGEVLYGAGDADLGLQGELVLDSSSELVARTPGGRLLLVPEIVTDDLHALGAVEKGSNVLETLADAGRALFRGHSFDAPTRARIESLVSRRLDGIERHLREGVRLPRERIVRRPWDGTVSEGVPRVLLRLEVLAK